MSPFGVHPRVSVAIGLGLLLTMLGGAPAVADSAVGHTGTTGSHSLVDSAASPGVKCKYRYLGADLDWYKLKRITVAPPRVRAIAGSQQVGWRFTVQRRTAFEGPPGPWYETYSSSVQTATTDSAHDASFTPKTVSVIGANETLSYRVLVKMFWYRANGSIQGTAVHKVDWYRLVNTYLPYDESVDHYLCSGSA